MKPFLKNKNREGGHVNIFSELLLTDKFLHFIQMNATSYYY